MSIQYFPPGLDGTGDEFLNNIIVINQQPVELTASENPISYNFGTADIGADAAATITVDITGEIFENDTFKITSALDSFSDIEIIAKAVPAFGEFITGLVAADIGNSIANALNENVVFNRLFYADSLTAPGSVIVTALNPGRIYNMIFAGVGNFSLASGTNGTDSNFGSSVRDFAIYVDVFANAPGGFGDPINKNDLERQTRIQKNYQFNDQTNFDISGIIKDNVKINKPFWQPFFFNPEALTPYSLLFGFIARNDDGSTTRTVTGSTAVKWAVNGALPFNCPNDLTPYILQDGATDAKFLSNAPTCRDWFEGSHQFLSILYKEQLGLNTAVYYVRFKFYDGTVSGESLLFVAGGSNRRFITINLSLFPLNFVETTLGKKVKEFTITARYETTFPFSASDATEAITFKVRRDCPERFKDFVFINQLGGFEGLRLIERTRQTTRRTVTKFEKTLQFFPQKIDEVNSIKNARVTCSETWATGFLPEEYYPVLKEVASATKAWIFEEPFYIPVIVEKVKIEFDDSADKYNLIIEFTKTVTENSVTQ